jgi:hypothetical protein
MKETNNDLKFGKGKVTRRESIKYAGLLMGTPLLAKVFFGPLKAFAQNIKLPDPGMKKVIMQAFKNRRTTRSYNGKELSDQEISETRH